MSSSCFLFFSYHNDSRSNKQQTLNVTEFVVFPQYGVVGLINEIVE